ncbi:MAG TPA: hypothetical protein PLX66_02170 [Bacilli bacterium]|nr:hypothetical protein [Bacilli bacterium]
MKKISKLGLLALVIVFSLFITGCGKKTALTADEFKNQMETLGFDVIDATEYITDETVATAYIAQKADAYQVEFYVFTTDDAAKAGYDQYVANLKVIAGSETNANTEVTNNTYYKYTDKAGDYYSATIKVDKTLLYVRALSTYQSEIDQIIDELNY